MRAAARGRRARGVRARRRRAGAGRRVRRRAPSLLAAMATLRDAFPEIGITGYPESHHLISDETDDPGDVREGVDGDVHRQPDLLRRGRDRRTWIARVRARGTTLPIWIGVPGRRRLREARADLDEDRPRRVHAVPARAPRRGCAGWSRGRFKPDRPRPRARRALCLTRRQRRRASTSTRSTRWPGSSGGAVRRWSGWAARGARVTRPARGAARPGSRGGTARERVARLLLSCPDRPGIVAAVSQLPVATTARTSSSPTSTRPIPRAATFFMRLEFELGEPGDDAGRLRAGVRRRRSRSRSG